jgi:hypothetical protein
MRRILKSTAPFFVLVAMAVGLAIVPSEAVHACINTTTGTQDASGFFSIPPWHHYLACSEDGGVNNDIELDQLWLIGAALLEGLMRVAGVVSIFFIIYGGFKYMSSQGSPDGTASARRTIINSLVGLLIAIFASVVVSFAMDLLAGGSGGGDALPETTTNGVIQRVLNFIYALSGITAAVYIVIGAIKYTTSTGDSGKTLSARNTIIYAVVGMIIVLSAYLITGALLNRV